MFDISKVESKGGVMTEGLGEGDISGGKHKGFNAKSMTVIIAPWGAQHRNSMSLSRPRPAYGLLGATVISNIESTYSAQAPRIEPGENLDVHA